MKKIFWLLLAALPLMTGVTFAEDVFVPNNNILTDTKISLESFVIGVDPKIFLPI